jgi:phospholipid/cholesterol/gamma-HCH transport system permease protein
MNYTATAPPFYLRLVYLIASFGHTILQTIVAFGQFCRFSKATLLGIASVRTWARRDRLGRQLFFVGTMSIPVLVVTGGFVGAILALEGYAQFAAIGQEGRLGGIINLSVVKQLGPTLAAVMIAGRVGCSLAAELGTMKVTEQLDAMRAMAADPIRVLVVPRFLACVVMIPSLTLWSNLFGVIGGWIITTKSHPTDPDVYWRFSAEFVGWFDIVNGLVKAVCFGAAIGLISCYKGFNCRPGAEGVGRATTGAFVSSFMAIITINLALAPFLNDIDIWISGGITSVFA